MKHEECPLKNGALTTPPSVVQGIHELSFEVDPHGGSGTRYMECEVCGKGFSIFEDVGYHFPQYHWPSECLRSDETETSPTV